MQNGQYYHVVNQELIVTNYSLLIVHYYVLIKVSICPRPKGSLLARKLIHAPAGSLQGGGHLGGGVSYLKVQARLM